MTSELRRIRTGGSTAFLTVIVAIAVLYFAQVVLIPIALAILLAFLLGPLVNRVRRWGLGRIGAVAVVLSAAALFLVIVGGTMAVQFAEFVPRVPEYQANVRKKMAAIRNSEVLSRFTKVIRGVNKELKPASQPTESSADPSEVKPVPVEIRQDAISLVDMAPRILRPAVDLVVMVGIVIVFVIFMLIQREDLRDRVIRLAGETRVNLTTQVLDDAAQRLSRYLLAQLGLNAVFGVIAAAGLYLIGIPNPLLWGMLAIVLRYIPFLGIWIAAILPALIAFAVEPGWVKVPAVFGLYFGTDLLVINFAEPLVYGGSTGVSPIAILVAAVFWTWLWGPVGLLLATPLTLCVVVLGRYVPSLHFLSVILSDEKVLSPETRFYQRMLAMDLDEAMDVCEDYLKGHTLEDLYDVVIIPGLRLAEQEQHRGLLDEARQKYIFQNTRLLIEDLPDRADELRQAGATREVDARKGAHKNDRQGALKVVEALSHTSVVCIPARDEADSLAAQMLAQLLSRRGIIAKELPLALASESLEAVEKEGARIACITCVPPVGYTHARYLSRRLQARFKDIRLVVAILTEEGLECLRQKEPAITADELAATLKQAQAGILSLVPVAAQDEVLPTVASA